MDEAKLLLENGADGIAFGFLKDDGSIAIEETKAMVELIHSYKKEILSESGNTQPAECGI